MYKVDFKRLAIHHLPTFFRKPLIFGLLRAALVPLEQLYDTFLNKRAMQIYRLTHNGQTCYLQAALNDSFDPYSRRIKVLTVEREGEWLYAVTETGENIPVATAEGEDSADVPIVYDELALTAEQNNFVVYLPATIYQTRLEAVKTLVNTYKLMSKRAIYVPQSTTVTSADNRKKFDDVLKEYRYGNLDAKKLEIIKDSNINIVSNADSRIYK